MCSPIFIATLCGEKVHSPKEFILGSKVCNYDLTIESVSVQLEAPL